MMKLRKWIFRLLLAGLVALGVMEGVARFVIGLGTPPLTIPDPDIEYLFKPSQDVSRFGNRQLYNAYSMRNEDFPKAKEAGEFRILCLGDSVLNGGNLTDHERLATTMLERRLRTESGTPVRVMNASAGSWGTPNMLAYVNRFGLFDADVVVTVLSSHDIEDVPKFYPLNPATHPTRRPCCALWEGITRYAPRYVPALRPILQSDKYYVPIQPGPQRMEQMKCDAHEVALDSLSLLYAKSRAAGCKFILVLHGEKSEVLSGEFTEGHELFLNWAGEHSVQVVNLSPAEAAGLKAGIDPYRKNDTVHISDAGQSLLADQLFPILSDLISVTKTLQSKPTKPAHPN